MVSIVNGWQAWLERGGFVVAIYWKAISVARGGFDKLLTISRYGVTFG